MFTRIMRAERDYFNLKVLIKLLMQNRPLDSFPLLPGNIPVERCDARSAKTTTTTCPTR